MTISDILNSLDDLSALDKTDAILIVLHLFDVALLLVSALPTLALLFTNFAKAIMTLTNILDEDIEECRKTVDDIRTSKC